MKPKVEAHDDDSQRYGDQMQSLRGTSTEHAQRKNVSQTCTLKPDAQKQQPMEEAQIERADNMMEHLAFKLEEFLTRLLQQHCCSPRLELDCEDICVRDNMYLGRRI